ncbi:MAG: hypothetical protein ACRD88_19825, partial [Terriglobia bacterium]
VWRVIAWGMIVAGGIFGETSSAQAPAGARAQAQAGAARQQAAPRQAAPAAPGATTPPAVPVLPPAGERRDPFRPIEIKRAELIAPICTQGGKQGLLIGQLLLQGIARTVQGDWVAVVDNKTGRAYFLRTKDELCNGVVLRVDQESLAMEERTVDSFGRTRTREVVLRPPDQ